MKTRLTHKRLSELRKPSSFVINEPVTITLDPSGKLWINGNTSCILRFCRIPKESMITFDGKKVLFLDVTIIGEIT